MTISHKKIMTIVALRRMIVKEPTGIEIETLRREGIEKDIGKKIEIGKDNEIDNEKEIEIGLEKEAETETGKETEIGSEIGNKIGTTKIL
jgi:hypothetical protein